MNSEEYLDASELIDLLYSGAYQSGLFIHLRNHVYHVSTTPCCCTHATKFYELLKGRIG